MYICKEYHLYLCMLINGCSPLYATCSDITKNKYINKRRSMGIPRYVPEIWIKPFGTPSIREENAKEKLQRVLPRTLSTTNCRTGKICIIPARLRVARNS